MAQEIARLSPDTPFLTVAEEGCMQINFENKVAPVTGAAKGVGLSHAWTFAQPSRVKTPSSALPPGRAERGLAEFDHGSRRPQMNLIYEAPRETVIAEVERWLSQAIARPHCAMASPS